MTQQEIQEQLQRQQEIILNRKARLAATDYIANKLAEGKATKTEYEAQIDERQQWRDDINAAEAETARLQAIEPEEPQAETPAEGE